MPLRCSTMMAAKGLAVGLSCAAVEVLLSGDGRQSKG